MLSTASSAINSVITTLNSMATALTEAQTPNANLGAINTSLASLGQQLTDAVNGASFNGLNMLNGHSDHPSAHYVTGDFVSGYNATSNGGTVNTIGMATQTVYGQDRSLVGQRRLRSLRHVDHAPRRMALAPSLTARTRPTPAGHDNASR